jgi:hypothetical protein
MRRIFALIFAMLMLMCLAGCAEKKTDPFAMDELSKAEEVGVVPDEYRMIVENDILNGCNMGGCAAFGDRFLVERRSEKGMEITLFDRKGNELAKHSVTQAELNYRPTDLLLACSDGGFMFALECDAVTDENGGVSVVPAEIVKCGADGAVEWTTKLEGMSAGPFSRAFERNGVYYVFGVYRENPINDYTHIIMLKLGLDGKVLKQNTVGGSDFDMLRRAEETDNGFTLHVNSQSRNGDFFEIKKEKPPYTGRYFIVKTDLELEEKDVSLGKTEYCDRELYSVGTLKGEDIEQNRRMKDVPGYVKLVIDNGDTYLVVSENNTGVYKKTPPFVSAIWYYTETVYSVFDKDGKLIARKTYDSSTQWDLVLRAFNAEYYRE